jgi:hypothetical protein
MSKLFVLFVLSLTAGLCLTGCSKSAAPDASSQQSATIKLKDGTTFSGSVSKSDTSSITLTSADGQTRTYPMAQVDSVQYGAAPADQPPPPAASSPAPAAAPAPQANASAKPSPAPSAPPAPREPPRVIPSGTKLSVRNNDTISASEANVGQTYSGVIAADVADADGAIAIPKGSNATLIVRAAAGQGKVKGQSELALDVDSVEVNGHTYQLETVDVVKKGSEGLGANRRTAEFSGGGAVLGTIIGAVAGGGKGAAIGALAGAGAGAVTQTVTRGKAVKVPSETVLTFQLEAPVTIRRSR